MKVTYTLLAVMIDVTDLNGERHEYHYKLMDDLRVQCY